ATFSDLALAKPGFYQLQATDGGDTQATSGKFKIAGDKLVIKRQPINADINHGIPLIVEIEDSKGKPDVNSASDAVLSMNAVTGGLGAVLSGTTAVHFINGVATFIAGAGPTIDRPGNYTFTVTEEDFSTGVLAPTNTTSPVTSKPFTISGLQLMFLQQPPSSSDPLAPIPVSIELVDSHHIKVSSENTAQVQLNFNTVADGFGARLGGTITATFTAGVATFPAAATVNLNAPGTYTLTVTEPDQAVGAAKPGTSR